MVHDVDRTLLKAVACLPGLLFADEVQAEFTVLYGHEEFRNAEGMLREYLGKVRSSAETDREKAMTAIRTSAGERASIRL